MEEGQARPSITALLRQVGAAEALDGLFGLLIEVLPLGVTIHSADPESRLILMNKAAIELVRPVLSRYQGHSLSEVMPGEHAPELATLLEGARTTGRPSRQRGYQSPDGRIWDVDVFPVAGRDGRPRLLLALFDELSMPSILRRRLAETHELAVRALIDVSAHVGTDSEPELFGQLSKTLTELIHARQAVFVRWDGDKLIHGVPDGYGIDPDLIQLLEAPCIPGADGFIERIVFGDQVFRGVWRPDDPQTAEYGYLLQALGVSTALGVPWRSGPSPVGIVAAFESTRPGGFNDEDIWVARLAGLVAGLI
jgi:PAS fold